VTSRTLASSAVRFLRTDLEAFVVDHRASRDAARR